MSSSNEELWDQLAARVTRSQVGGVRAEDDDVLAAADIVEATINPHRGAQAGMAGAGSPGMMPPMMMGGAGGMGGTGGGTLGGARPAEPAVAPLSAPAQAPTVAGVPGEARPLTKSPGAGPGAGGIGAGAVGGGGAPGGAGAPPSGEEVPGGTAEAVVEPASEVAGVTMVSGEVADVGRAAAPRMPQEPEHIDGFVADPAQLHGLGERWTGLAGRVAAVPRHPESGMGLFEAAQRSQLTLSQQIDAWRTGAVDEFEGIAERLHETAAQYEGVDDAGIAELRRTEGLRA